MDTVEVSTEVRVPPQDAYEFLRDVPGYERYSEHLASVRQHGDGGPGTEYEFTFQWWKLTQDVRVRVTETDAPREIRWEVLGNLDAHGKWVVEEIVAGDGDEFRDGAGSCDGQESREGAGSRVTLVVAYDADSGRDAIDLPSLVSFDWVADRVVALLESEGEKVVERAVADLEGDRRPVELTVETR